MENKFEDLHAELIKHLCEMLIDDQYLLRDKNSFVNDPQLDILIFEIFIHQFWGRPAYEDLISEFLKAENSDQDTFDDRLRDEVYEVLSKARGSTELKPRIKHARKTSHGV